MIAATDEICAHDCTDAAFIDHVVHELWPLVSTDQQPHPVAAGWLVGHPDFRFIQIDLCGNACGIGVIFKQEVHTLLLPAIRGRLAIKAAQAALAHAWATTDFPYFTSYAYSHRPEVAWFARRMGFTPTETINDGSTVNGSPVTRTNFICNRPSQCPSQDH